MHVTNPQLAAMLAAEREEADELRAAGIGDEDLPESLDIRQTWHGLHFLLAGTAWEPGPGAASAVLGGREIGDEIVYGPARVLSVAEVANVASGLEAITEAELAARHDPQAMATVEIYGAWEDVEWLLEAFRQVRDFYVDARKRGNAILLAIV